MTKHASRSVRGTTKLSISSTTRPRVLITGACRGIGRACAEALGKNGAELILCDNDAEKLSELAESLGAIGRFCDVASEASVAIFAADILDTFPVLDMVINAAGGGYERTLGMYRVSRALLPALRRGTHLNLLLSFPPADEEVDAGIFPYASSGQAFQRLSAALAAETRGSSVKVVVGCTKNRHLSQVLPDQNARHQPDDGNFQLGECDVGVLTAQIASLFDAPKSAEWRKAG